jgi:Kinetochore CENP-C fungal homologue, Mif2, N-terminal
MEELDGMFSSPEKSFDDDEGDNDDDDDEMMGSEGMSMDEGMPLFTSSLMCKQNLQCRQRPPPDRLSRALAILPAHRQIAAQERAGRLAATHTGPALVAHGAA